MLSRLNQLKEDEPIGSFLARNFSEPGFEGLLQSVRGFAEGYDAADLNQVSAFSLREEWSDTNDETQYRIQGGYGQLIQYLENQIIDLNGEILLGSPIKTIAWGNHEIEVITSEGRKLEGSQVIITVPIGVLKSQGINFKPQLPERYQAAINEIGFGAVTKFLFEFTPHFWDNVIQRKRANMAFQFSDAEIPTWWSQNPSSQPLLTGWKGGPSVLKGPRDYATLFAKATDSLSYIFECSPTVVESSTIHSVITNWTDDPYSMGAYAYSTVGSEEARAILTTPIGERLHFAGEALYQGPAMGTVEAAIQSGIDVATRVKAAFVIT